MALLSVAIVSAFGGAGRKKKPFRISKHSTSTLAEQEIAKQFEIRTDNQLLSSFSKHPWEAYESTLRLVVGGVVETGKKSKKPVDHAHTLAFLLSPLSLNDVPVPPALTATDPVAFRSGMEQQRQAFMVTNNLNEAQYQYAIRILTYMGDFCAKRGLAAPLRCGAVNGDYNSLRIALNCYSLRSTNPFKSWTMNCVSTRMANRDPGISRAGMPPAASISINPETSL